MVICIVLLKCPDITSCFLNAFKVYDYEKKELLERKEFINISYFQYVTRKFGKNLKIVFMLYL